MEKYFPNSDTQLVLGEEEGRVLREEKKMQKRVSREAREGDSHPLVITTCLALDKCFLTEYSQNFCKQRVCQPHFRDKETGTQNG